MVYLFLVAMIDYSNFKAIKNGWHSTCAKDISNSLVLMLSWSANRGNFEAWKQFPIIVFLFRIEDPPLIIWYDRPMIKKGSRPWREGQSIMDTMSQRRFDSWGSTAFYAVACFHCALKQTSSTSSFLLQNHKEQEGHFLATLPQSLHLLPFQNEFIHTLYLTFFDNNCTILQSTFLNGDLNPPTWLKLCCK